MRATFRFYEERGTANANVSERPASGAFIDRSKAQRSEP